jgi:hypothetical protein
LKIGGSIAGCRKSATGRSVDPVGNSALWCGPIMVQTNTGFEGAELCEAGRNILRSFW